MYTQNKMPPMIDIGEFTKHKISEEFKKSCEKASKLFKQSKKEESQGRDLPPAQPHETRCKELCETREREIKTKSK